jgi:hypothetical protein
MLVELDPEKYLSFVKESKGKKIIFVVMKKALYGMLQSALLYYKKFRSDIEGIRCKINPYNPIKNPNQNNWLKLLKIINRHKRYRNFSGT